MNEAVDDVRCAQPLVRRKMAGPPGGRTLSNPPNSRLSYTRSDRRVSHLYLKKSIISSLVSLLSQTAVL